MKNSKWYIIARSWWIKYILPIRLVKLQNIRFYQNSGKFAYKYLSKFFLIYIIFSNVSKQKTNLNHSQIPQSIAQ